MSLQRQPKATPQWAPSSTRIHVHIVPSLLRNDGTVYTVSMTAAEARQTARTLLDLAGAVDADGERIATEIAGIGTPGSGGGEPA